MEYKRRIKQFNNIIQSINKRKNVIISGEKQRYATDIYMDNIVWSERNDYFWDVYYYNIVTEKITRITNNKSQQSQPKIWKDRIVWQDGRNGNADIYLYNISSETEIQITDNLSAQENPDIWGNYIVWEDMRYNYFSDIYLFDLRTMKESRITSNSSYELEPIVWGNTIVWKAKNVSELFSYNIDTKISTQLTTTPQEAYFYHPCIYQNKVVFAYEEEGVDYKNIYECNIDNKSFTQISNTNSNQKYPSIYGDWILWQDDRFEYSSIIAYKRFFDIDGDGIIDIEGEFPEDPTEWNDTDSDG